MPLYFSDGEPFSDGAGPYTCRPATSQDNTDRIFITIAIEGQQTQAVLDTGGVYLICDPELAEFLDLDPAAALDKITIRVRGTAYRGSLYRVQVSIPAQEGKSVLFEATAFVPDPEPSWPLPTYLGWHGCLERFRFAVDPTQDMFYFGPA